MIRALWFAVKVALLVAAAVWVADRPGTIDIHWMEYDITVQVGFALLCLLAFLLLTLSIHGLLLYLTGFGGHWRHRRAGRRAQRGLKALALGYSAAAAGDAKVASYQAHRARALLPDDKGLAALLESQAARLRGDTEGARKAYEELLANGDTAFMGLRGMIGAATAAEDYEGALRHARAAMKLNPKSPWIVRTVYALEARGGQWDAAAKTLRTAEKRDLFPAERIASDRAAMHVAQADVAERENRTADMIAHLRKALKIDAGFVPAVTRLVRYDLSRKRWRDAVGVLERAWKANPHPELATLWADVAPANKSYDVSTRLRWFEKLVALRPDSVESQLAAAHVAGEDRLWTEARQYLVAAERIAPGARLYRLWAACEEAQGHFGEERRFNDLAATAPGDRMWVCRETGRIYEQWSPIAQPHGSFNTIAWDYPRGGVPVAATSGDDIIENAGVLPLFRA